MCVGGEGGAGGGLGKQAGQLEEGTAALRERVHHETKFRCHSGQWPVYYIYKCCEGLLYLGMEWRIIILSRNGVKDYFI